ncbi:unnamed protein product [Parnassius apollo]|uniref:(apollo) hypothetical protein n=1 Tax=Parnassius apollo TaxID=110799 RepID=A0A8S3Y2M1_PARAO|nr:unnamed protein product [Parnassius apollo]
MVKHVNKHINEDTGLPAQIVLLLDTLKQQCSDRFQNIESNPLYAEATILDPRFKGFAFHSQEIFNIAVTTLRQWMYCTWKLKELKDDLKKRGAKITGKKADLVERSESYVLCLYNQQSPLASQSQAIDVPAVELYQDVNSSTILPKITKKHIQSYFDRFNRNISDAVKLYESRYLLILRSTTFAQETYLKGRFSPVNKG